MTTPRARRVEVPPAVQAGGRFADANYAWAFELPAPNARSMTPERWARAVFEDAPAFLRGVLPVAWKAGLGLRMGPRRSPDHILGWHLRDSSPDSATIEADSWMMDTQNVVLVDDANVKWVTFVRYNNGIGRVFWALARPIHQLTVAARLKSARKKTAV